ncbi:MAG: DUF3108 domain-containing protein [Bermanella sp.]
MFKFIISAALLLCSISISFAEAPLANSDGSRESVALSSPTLTPYSANYEVTWKASWFPVTIEATRTLKAAEEYDWTLSFEAYSSIADLSEISHFNVFEQVILPQKYRYKTTGFLSKSHRSQEFNWAEKTLWLPKKDSWAQYELPEHLQDNMSYQEQIRLELMAGKTQFEYPIAYKNRLKHYYFKVVGEGLLKTKQGNIATIEVKQTHLKNKKESTRIWYAKDYDYLLVKLVKVKGNGDKNTILLKDAQLEGRTLLGF